MNVVTVRNKKYKVNIENQGTSACRVKFVYNKKKFETEDFIPSNINSKMLHIVLQSIIQREIYDYNKRRTMISKTRQMYGANVKLMAEV